MNLVSVKGPAGLCYALVARILIALYSGYRYVMSVGFIVHFSG